MLSPLEGKKIKKSEKVKYIQHCFFNPATITMQGSENSENTSSDEDNVSESEENTCSMTTPILQVQVRHLIMTVMVKKTDILLNSYLL